MTSYVIFFQADHGHGSNHDGKVAHGKIKAYGIANLIVEMLHNFVDGIAIGLAFLEGAEQGMAVSWAVVAHELPQELGDFMVLRSAGYTVPQLLFWNFLASLTCVGGVGVAHWLGSTASILVQQKLMAITAGSFLSLSLNMIAPQVFESIHKRHEKVLHRVLAQVVCLFIAGLSLYILILVGELEEGAHDHGHGHGHGHGHAHGHHHSEL